MYNVYVYYKLVDPTTHTGEKNLPPTCECVETFLPSNPTLQAMIKLLSFNTQSYIQVIPRHRTGNIPLNIALHKAIPGAYLA